MHSWFGLPESGAAFSCQEENVLPTAPGYFSFSRWWCLKGLPNGLLGFRFKVKAKIKFHEALQFELRTHHLLIAVFAKTP